MIAMSGAMGAPAIGISFGVQQNIVNQHSRTHARAAGTPQPSWLTTAQTGQQHLNAAPGGSLSAPPGVAAGGRVSAILQCVENFGTIGANVEH